MERKSNSISTRVKTPYPGKQRSAEEDVCETCKRPWKTNSPDKEKGDFTREKNTSDQKQQNDGKYYQSKESSNRTRQESSNNSEKFVNHKNPPEKGDSLPPTKSFNRSKNTQEKSNDQSKSNQPSKNNLVTWENSSRNEGQQERSEHGGWKSDTSRKQERTDGAGGKSGPSKNWQKNSQQSSSDYSGKRCETEGCRRADGRNNSYERSPPTNPFRVGVYEGNAGAVSVDIYSL